MSGRLVGIPDIEGYFGRDDRQRDFARFCNLVILAETSRPLPTFPNLADSPGADGGFDGSWELPADNTATSNAQPFGVAGWNAFQFKARKPGTPLSKLVASIRGAAAEMIRRTNRHGELRRYTLFTNLGLGRPEAASTKGKVHLKNALRDLKDAILEGLPEGESLEVEIFGADRLQTVVNTRPAVRDTFFGAELFWPWEVAFEHLRKQASFPALALVGREGELARLRSMLTEPEVRFIGLTGGSGMGKSRLVLEATCSTSAEILFVRSPAKAEFLKRDPRSYDSIGGLTIVVDDLSPAEAHQLSEQLSLCQRLRVVATVPAEEHLPNITLSQSARVRHLPVTPLKSEACHQLLVACGIKISAAAREWIVQESGGNPQVLLLAAENGRNLQTSEGRRPKRRRQATPPPSRRGRRNAGSGNSGGPQSTLSLRHFKERPHRRSWPNLLSFSQPFDRSSAESCASPARSAGGLWASAQRGLRLSSDAGGIPP